MSIKSVKKTLSKRLDEIELIKVILKYIKCNNCNKYHLNLKEKYKCDCEYYRLNCEVCGYRCINECYGCGERYEECDLCYEYFLSKKCECYERCEWCPELIEDCVCPERIDNKRSFLNYIFDWFNSYWLINKN